MPYYLDAEKISLDDLQKRITETDLVPSRGSLLEEIDEIFLKLKAHGFVALADLRTGLKNPKNIPALSEEVGVDADVIDALYVLADLTRIQWVSPTVAGMLVSAGYTDAKAVSDADPERLCSDLDRINKENKYFDGKIGLRDIRRLVKAASYVS